MTFKHSIRHVSAQEMTEIDGWIELGMNIIANYRADQSVSVYRNMDNAYAAWATEDVQAYSDEQVLLGLGAVLGNRLSHKHKSPWQVSYDSRFGLITH